MLSLKTFNVPLTDSIRKFVPASVTARKRISL